MNIKSYILQQQHNSSTIFGYVFAICVGVWLTFQIFPAALLLNGPSDTALIIEDGAQHIAGQRYFIADAWRWPLLKTMLLSPPEGVSIAMTDSIPLLALPTKLLAPFLPPHFTSIFLWLWLSYLLQPVAAVYALRAAGERQIFPAVAIALMAVAIPSWIYRSTHEALCGHFLLLLALGLYFLIVRGQLRSWWPPYALMIVALLVHPYLLAMATAILWAAPLSQAIARQRDWRRTAVHIAGATLVTGGLALLLGYGSAGGSSSSGGFGFYSMNLLSPLFPFGSDIFARFKAPLDATGGQAAEGYQYLGIGLIGLIGVTAVTLMFSTDTLFLRNHIGLIAVSAALICLALSNKIYAGDYRLLSLAHPPDFMEQFRSSGRFFWPVTYVLLVGVVSALPRLLDRRIASVLLLLAALTQYGETRSLRHSVAAAMEAKQKPGPVTALTLRQIIAGAKQVTIRPLFNCSSSNDSYWLTYVIYEASFQATSLDTMYTARAAHAPDCSFARAYRPIEDGELRIFLPPVARTAHWFLPDADKFCRRLEEMTICSREPERLVGLGDPPLPPSVATGHDWLMTAPEMPTILSLGWSGLEPSGVWTDGLTALLAITFGERHPSGVRFTMEGNAYIGKSEAGQSHPPQGLRLSVNERVVAEWTFYDGAPRRLEADIPPDALSPVVQRLRLDIFQPARPIDDGLSSDPRSLGWLLKSFRFDDLPAARETRQ